MSDPSRSEFGDFLRSRRAKLNPKAVEIGIVIRGENFRRLEDSEVESYIEKVNAA